jgi:nicotinamidase-related amidase
MNVTDAKPTPFSFPPASTALIVIDMQVDFMERGGWADAIGLDVDALAPVVPVIAALLDCFRQAGMPVIFTREGHRPDLADCPPFKLARRSPKVGDQGPRGRYMVTGEVCNDIIPELAPLPGEPVIDKPGAGSFYATQLDQILRLKGVTHLVITGVTTDVCVNATIREGNDRGYGCLLIEDATASYNADFTDAIFAMLRTGIAGATAQCADLIAAIGSAALARAIA